MKVGMFMMDFETLGIMDHTFRQGRHLVRYGAVLLIFSLNVRYGKFNKVRYGTVSLAKYGTVW